MCITQMGHIVVKDRILIAFHLDICSFTQLRCINVFMHSCQMLVFVLLVMLRSLQLIMSSPAVEIHHIYILFHFSMAIAGMSGLQVIVC